MNKHALLGLGSGLGLVGLLAGSACTEDFGQFQFTGEGGGAGTGGAPATTSSLITTGTATTGTTTTGTTTTGSTTTGSTTGSTTTGTTTATTTAATTTSGGGPIDVPCGSGGTCDVENSNEFCCISNNGGTNGNCNVDCNNGNEAQLECNEPDDCPGEVCCIDRPSATSVSDSQCTGGSCTAGGEFIACTIGGPACASGSCSQLAGLPVGYLACQP